MAKYTKSREKKNPRRRRMDGTISQKRKQFLKTENSF
jgi:hypothetical protein